MHDEVLCTHSQKHITMDIDNLRTDFLFLANDPYPIVRPDTNHFRFLSQSTMFSASARRFARVSIRSVKSFCFNLEHIACPCSLCVCRWCCWNCLNCAVEEASSCSGARKRLSWHMARFFHQCHHALGVTVSLVNLVSVRQTMNRFLTQWRKSRMRAVPL